MNRKKHLLLVSLCLVVLGGILLLVSYSLSDGSSEKILTPDFEFQTIQIDLSDCRLSVRSADSTYVVMRGFRESDLTLHEKNGVLILSRREFGDSTITLSGIAKYWFEGKDRVDEKEIILYLSSEDAEKPINIALQDSILLLENDLDYLTLHADRSSVSANSFSFLRFDANLHGCTTQLTLSLHADDFSRNVESFDTDFSVNGDTHVNADYYEAENPSAEFIVEASGGSFSLNYLLGENK